MDASRWISDLLEHDLLVESDLQQYAAAETYLWCHNADQQLSPRARDECPNGVIAKACREKMRRDRLNDRFVELSAVLEPDKTPKTDKASILRDAARILSQLRVETQHLRDANQQLQEAIKELKDEKNDLRDEKFILKSEKERLEKQLTSVNSIPPDYMSHASAVHAAGIAAFSPQTGGHHLQKPDPFADVSFSLAMSQWMPQATVDISNDHVLRPPVA
ncbi:hypothetical protein L7F22_009419 [Adiantum nelumboides]|nr:hypothetical protein [Adiantum nelumboides]